MNLYYLHQNKLNGWDTYDSCVIAAESKQQAIDLSITILARNCGWGEWPNEPSDIQIEEIGTANSNYNKPAIVCSSFNAG